MLPAKTGWENGRLEGEKPVSTSSVAWGRLWLIAHELPTTTPQKCLMASDCAVAVGAGALQSQAVHPGEGLGSVGSRRVDGR